jgi:recombination protein RecR
MIIPQPIKKFIELFSDIPSIGPRQASRFAFWFIRQGPSIIFEYSETIRALGEKIGICPECFFVVEKTPSLDKRCEICKDKNRNRKVIAIVEKETDLITIEKTNSYNGLYHVLGETINPLDQDWKKTLKIDTLLERIKRAKSEIEEIILALPSTNRGELTATEISRIINQTNPNIKITRLGRGLPRGAEIEFMDTETLKEALTGRK